MKSLLLLTQVLPYPPDSGPKVKTWNVLKYLARNYRVTLVSFVRGDQTADIEVLKRHCAAVHTVPITRSIPGELKAGVRSVLTNQPWMMLRDDRAEMRAMVDRVSQSTRFDVVHADQLNMGQFALRVPGAHKVLDLHNALWLLYKRQAAHMRGPRRLLLERDWRLLKTYEGQMCNRFDAVLAVSDEDRLALREAGMRADKTVAVVPITLDGDEVPAVERASDAAHVLHIGTMYWPPNIDGVTWFIERVWPIIREKRPNAQFDCVGARPPQQLRDLASRTPGVNITGYVPDTGPYLKTTGVFVVPLLAGGGMRVKILNAMAQALPIVTTTLGCEGINVESGKNALIADQPDAFARAVLSVLDDRARADALGAAARATFERLYDYRMALQAMAPAFPNA
jgi:polysaccharide biosynthesis protein PslH